MITIEEVCFGFVHLFKFWQYFSDSIFSAHLTHAQYQVTCEYLSKTTIYLELVTLICIFMTFMGLHDE